jgi:hypothetical protein
VQNALNRFYNADVVPMEQDSGGEKLFARYKSTDSAWFSLHPGACRCLHSVWPCYVTESDYAGTDSDEEVIDVEGVMQLILDLGIEPVDKALVCLLSHSNLIKNGL